MAVLWREITSRAVMERSLRLWRTGLTRRPEPLCMFEQTVFGPFISAVCRAACRTKPSADLSSFGLRRRVRVHGSERCHLEAHCRAVALGLYRSHSHSCPLHLSSILVSTHSRRRVTRGVPPPSQPTTKDSTTPRDAFTGSPVSSLGWLHAWSLS